MSTGGFGLGGGSGAGPSRMYSSLPYKGWREVTGWVEDFIDAIGYRFDVLNAKFISAVARAGLLDPTNADIDPATQYFATATKPPLGSSSTDTMLDVLLFIALGLSNTDSNLSVAQKQALVRVGWDALKRKGTRLQLLNLTSQITDGIVQGWTVPPNNFSLILPDGAPSPGWGDWVQPDNVTSALMRPWLFDAVRQVNGAGIPAFGQLGVGYSQFRAGYSAAGETVFPVGSRINILANEHFKDWSGGLPVNWAPVTGGGTSTANIAEETGDSFANWEFTGSAATLDLTGVVEGGIIGLSKSPTPASINNQVTHRFQLDYRYTNTQKVDVLCVNIVSLNRNGLQYSWNPDTQTWQGPGGAFFNIIVPQSNDLRMRFACDVIPQTVNGAVGGTDSIIVRVFATSDGTATTQNVYTLYRIGLYEKFDLAVETVAIGERTGWFPLVDSPGWTTCSAAIGAQQIEFANADRSAYRLVSSLTGVAFPYHPALNGHGYLAQSGADNIVKGSNAFTTDWTLTAATKTANVVISPLVGETVASAPRISGTGYGARIGQAGLTSPTNKRYIGGIWVKKLTADAGNQAGTVTVTAGSATIVGAGTAFLSSLIVGASLRTAGARDYLVTAIADDTHCTISSAASVTESAVTWRMSDFVVALQGNVTNQPTPIFLAQATGWKLVTFNGAFGASDTTLSLVVAAVTSPSTVQFSLASAYVVPVNTLHVETAYPPICQTSVGSTGHLYATVCVAQTLTPTADVLHPLTRRALGSVVRGSLGLTVVPTFDAGIQPDGAIFDIAQDEDRNRVALVVETNQLLLRRWDDSNVLWEAGLTLTTSATPATGQMTWRRDTAIVVRCIWDENSTMLSAGNGNAMSAPPPSWAPDDASLFTITIGNDLFSGSQFFGLIRGVELGAIGAPVI